MKKIYLACILGLLFGFEVSAQNDNGAIKITMEDQGTKETIPFANVVAYRDGVQVGVATTDVNGVAIIKPLPPGKYSVKGVYVGFKPVEMTGIIVGEGKTVDIKLPMGGGVELEEVVVISYQKPLIDPDTKSGGGLTRDEFQQLASKDINSAIATQAGVYQADEGAGINVRGSRSTNTTYFVDGVKVFGTPNLPQQSIEALNVITGGVPASYGDLTGGAVSISTRGPQAKYFGGIELISSQLTDAFKYNSLGFSFGGPILKRKDTAGVERTVLGFFVSGQGNHVKDPNPSFVPIYVLKDEKLDELKAQPLRPSPSGSGFVRTSEFVTKDDMITQKFRPNNALRSLALNGKIDWAPTPNTNISFGGYYEFEENHSTQGGHLNRALAAQLANQVFNSANNAVNNSNDWRVTFSATQKFGNTTADKSKTQSLISNSFFKFLISYERDRDITESPVHRDKVFNYGYVGKYDRTFVGYENPLNYQYTSDFVVDGQATNSFTYTGRQEQEVQFAASDMNPDMAAYTSYLFANAHPTLFLSMDAIRGNNALRNGDNPEQIYNLYTNFGTYPNFYTKQFLEQWRIATSFNTDVKNHALTLGFEFDQRISSNFYVLSAHQLWTRMRQLANSHTTQLDRSRPLVNADLSGTINYYYFDYLYQPEQQTQFSERLLDKLGLPRNYTGFVNTDALDPSIFSLEMFSAEDLLGNTDDNNLVNYAGYTHYGEKTGGNVDINKFLNERDENGRKTLPIGAFRPIYSSIYIMDKFDFKDIKFLAGLRVDRYDANQPVLKDKYALHELASVGDLSSMENLPAGFTEGIPGSISPDAAVYVAANPAGGKSPLAITGFREGDRWFNAEGIEISDPNLINSQDARPIPLYKDMANYEVNMSSGAFTNYKAVIIPQPRLGFSFPISDVSNFFAHYDWLMQRPTNSQINPLQYYYMNSSGGTPLISNPDQKPQITIDYELGFSQVLNERKNAALTITAFYKDFRNQINQRMVVGAYPKNYVMFDNIDFSTVKGLSFVFDFRRTAGSSINFNYTLQFAEGSGSNTNSGANLANSGQPNLRVLMPLDFDQRHSFVLNYDYRFGGKKEYLGPRFKRKKNDKDFHLFEDVGFNLTFMLGSGTPYTRWNTAIPINGGRANIAGQINGSSKPWNFRSNLRIDKNVPLSWGEENGKKKTANLNVYLQVLNLFNTRNIINVYNYTGAPDDDGYLSSTQGQAALALTNSAIAYTDLYNIRVNNPANYSRPRQTRIGILFEF